MELAFSVSSKSAVLEPHNSSALQFFDIANKIVSCNIRSKKFEGEIELLPQFVGHSARRSTALSVLNFPSSDQFLDKCFQYYFSMETIYGSR
jgi:hypothetical protein